MANENKKDFNAMMKNNKDMPKIQIVEDEKTIKKYGGTKMFFAPPVELKCFLHHHFIMMS